MFACLLVDLSGNGASHADWIRGAATRLAVGMELFGFYASRHYRMLQLNAYSQRQRALAQMLRALAPNVTDVVVVGYGYRCVQASCQWQCQCVCAVVCGYTSRPGDVCACGLCVGSVVDAGSARARASAPG